MPTPASVPPVPTALTKPSIRPSVWRQISGPVPSTWARRLATLSNWFAQIAPFGSVVRELFRDPSGVAHVVHRVLVRHRGHEDQLGAAQPEHVLLLLALGLRHHDHGPVAERVADQREADPGVAGGAFDDGAARAQQPLLLGVAHDPERRAILDRLARIEELGLAQDGAAGLLRRPPEVDERGVADQVDEGLLVHARGALRSDGAAGSLVEGAARLKRLHADAAWHDRPDRGSSGRPFGPEHRRDGSKRRPVDGPSAGPISCRRPWSGRRARTGSRPRATACGTRSTAGSRARPGCGRRA